MGEFLLLTSGMFLASYNSHPGTVLWQKETAQSALSRCFLWSFLVPWVKAVSHTRVVWVWVCGFPQGSQWESQWETLTRDEWNSRISDNGNQGLGMSVGNLNTKREREKDGKEAGPRLPKIISHIHGLSVSQLSCKRASIWPHQLQRQFHLCKETERSLKQILAASSQFVPRCPVTFHIACPEQQRPARTTVYWGPWRCWSIRSTTSSLTTMPFLCLQAPP